MIDRLLSTIAPHICCSCGQNFGILCENCISDINEEPFLQCIVCLRPTFQTNLCSRCLSKWGITGSWAVGGRYGALKQLINKYKFERTKAAVDVMARLLDERLPQLPLDTTVCYIPDIPAHRRQRGYDHMRLVAEAFARRRGFTCQELLVRKTNISQRGLTRTQRLESQRHAFIVNKRIKTPILLLDDIVTTGSTLRAGVEALRGATTKEIYVAVVARQPLDSHDDL